MFVALRNLVKCTLFISKVPQRQIAYFTRFRSATSSQAWGSTVPNGIKFAHWKATPVILLPHGSRTSGHTSFWTMHQSGLGLASVNRRANLVVRVVALRNLVKYTIWRCGTFGIKKHVFYRVPQRHKRLFALVPGVPLRQMVSCCVSVSVHDRGALHAARDKRHFTWWNPRCESK